VLTLLELSDEEARTLRIALDAQLHGLRTELASTETLEFRARLRATLDTLEAVAARLAAQGPMGANATTL
jgi:hypothetical protein